MAETIVRCRCGRLMVRRVNSENGSEFFACTGWTERDANDQPRCSETAKVPAHIRMQEAGASPLPGF